jgi:threonine dehydrogenase-like Zn-dependent dehydrogenase
MKSYRALRLRKDGVNLESVTYSGPLPLAKMRCSGVCGTDKHAIRGDYALVEGRVLGHENVALLGDRRVTWPAIMPCRECPRCKIGRENLCLEDQVFGLKCDEILAGGWAEFAPIPPGAVLLEVPQSLDDELAVLIETMASTKSLRKVDVAGARILIIGSGPIGMLSAIHARYLGARWVGITGYRPQADRIGDVIDEFYERELSLENFAEKYNIVMDAGGSTTSLEFSVDAVQPGGTVLESGCMVDKLSFNIARIVRKEITVITSLGYVPADFAWATEVVQANVRHLRNVITHSFRLEEAGDAVRLMMKSPHGKIVFFPK